MVFLTLSQRTGSLLQRRRRKEATRAANRVGLAFPLGPTAKLARINRRDVVVALPS